MEVVDPKIKTLSLFPPVSVVTLDIYGGWPPRHHRLQQPSAFKSNHKTRRNTIRTVQLCQQSIVSSIASGQSLGVEHACAFNTFDYDHQWTTMNQRGYISYYLPSDYLLNRIEGLPEVVDDLNSKFASYQRDHKGGS